MVLAGTLVMLINCISMLVLAVALRMLKTSLWCSVLLASSLFVMLFHGVSKLRYGFTLRPELFLLQRWWTFQVKHKFPTEFLNCKFYRVTKECVKMPKPFGLALPILMAFGLQSPNFKENIILYSWKVAVLFTHHLWVPLVAKKGCQPTRAHPPPTLRHSLLAPFLATLGTHRDEWQKTATFHLIKEIVIFTTHYFFHNLLFFSQPIIFFTTPGVVPMELGSHIIWPRLHHVAVTNGTKPHCSCIWVTFPCLVLDGMDWIP